MIIPLDDLSQFFAGLTPLPSGAVPLAAERGKISACVCLTPSGRWIRWWSGTRSMESMPPETQREVVGMAVEQLGGTAAAMAERLGVSPRTVEAWRSGKSPLPIRVAYEIAEILSSPNAYSGTDVP
jgi:DNA-binding XRE family transcriptional regulator